MINFKQTAAAALATALLSTPALAESTTFAQFTQLSTDKIVQFTNTGTSSMLQIAQSPSGFITLDFGPTGFVATSIQLMATTNAMGMMQNGTWQQGGYNGSIRFGNNGDLLTATFSGATFTVDSGGGSASLINSDPNSSITYTSNVLTLPNFDSKNFSLAFTGITPTFSAGSGFGANFTGNIAGSFAGDTDGDGSSGVIPEPASWAMMIMGFGLTGTAMRRRSRVRVVAS